MRVKLLNDGGFGFLQHLSFPIEVNAEPHNRLCSAVHVMSNALIEAGAESNCTILPSWTFADDEFEVVDE